MKLTPDPVFPFVQESFNIIISNEKKDADLNSVSQSQKPSYSL